jgi:hypothetical protein
MEYCNVLNCLTITIYFAKFFMLLPMLWLNGISLGLPEMDQIKPPPNTIGHVLTTTPTKGAPSGPLYLYGEQK